MLRYISKLMNQSSAAVGLLRMSGEKEILMLCSCELSLFIIDSSAISDVNMFNEDLKLLLEFSTIYFPPPYRSSSL